MKYYSEVLNKKFDTEKECLEAEQAEKVRKEQYTKAHDDLKAKVEAAYNIKKAADEEFNKLVDEYTTKYGTLTLGNHLLYTSKKPDITFNLLKDFFS